MHNSSEITFTLTISERVTQVPLYRDHAFVNFCKEKHQKERHSAVEYQSFIKYAEGDVRGYMCTA